MADAVIRPARSEDRAAVEALLGAAGLPLDGLGDGFPGGYAVAEVGDGLAGAAGVERHGADGLLRSVVVAAAWRGRGLGERLVRDRLAWATARGLESVFLLTTTAPGYFPRIGFRLAERANVPAAVRASKEFAAVCPASAALLELRLMPAASPPAGSAR
jgi:amino-acid N-acetyltransferase